jgi:hypothetical protein
MKPNACLVRDHIIQPARHVAKPANEARDDEPGANAEEDDTHDDGRPMP